MNKDDSKIPPLRKPRVRRAAPLQQATASATMRAQADDPTPMKLHANGVSLEVQVSGPADGEPLLMISGMGMQLVDWPQGWIDLLVEAGFRVIRYDMRDFGLSESMDHLGQPQLAAAAMFRMLGLKPSAPYTLADLAEDAIGLLDALDIRSAHICGASMGGMVAQDLVIRHPTRVRSLTLMMTSSGSPWVPRAQPHLLNQMIKRPPSRHDFDALVAHFVHMYRTIGSPAYPEPVEQMTQRVAASLRRSYRPRALERQAAAVLADTDKTRLLRQIKLPTLIVHGKADKLVPLAAGRDLARHIPGAVLDEIEGMGHDFPRELWPRFVEQMLSIAARAAVDGT